MPGTNVIIVAAGSGSRFGGPLPKQFCDLAGKPVLMHSVDAFRKEIPDAEITLVLSPQGNDIWQEICKERGIESPAVIIGGDTRYQSVCNALSSIASETEFVMVHDGARPFPPIPLLKRFKSFFENGDYAGLIPAVAVTDSLREIVSDGSRAVDRSKFRAVQTPQIFRASDFLHAYHSASGLDEHLFTDDAAVVERNGGKLLLVDGDVKNIKITNPGDLALAEFFLR